LPKATLFLSDSINSVAEKMTALIGWSEIPCTIV